MSTPQSNTSQTPSPTAQAQSNIASSKDQDTETALRLYLSHINEVRNNEDWDDAYGSMSLAYISDDDIPELIIDWPSAASGGQVLTVSNGELVSVQLSRGGGIAYIERENIFVHSNGHMDLYFTSVYTIRNGEFVRLHRGEVKDDFSEDDYRQIMNWDGEELSDTEYQERLNAAFDFSRAAYSWDNASSAEEIVQIINGLLGHGSTTAITQGSGLDERLFGTWIEQLPDDWPDYLTFVRVFSPDGTGSWWGDGPSQQFTWRVNGDELTMDVRDEIGDEWTNVIRYKIVGDTMTFTYDGGLQNIYLRESAASANQSSGDATTNQSSGNATANEVLYNGIPVLSFLDNSTYPLRDLSNVFGSPTNSVVDTVMQSYFNEAAIWGEFLGYREIGIFDLSALTVNGVSLDKDRDGLVNIFGIPIFDGIEEDIWGDQVWRLKYQDMTFTFRSPVNKAHSFMIRAKI
jgi:hypothetical protein